ncbi:hypothetical protein PVAND_016259 [Polypedilum vanderplanki]|uniref:Uncharacterized protein n=1 Tax=Polypedilum vanderplanki TaxID=319348 RepID=A0A9J6BF23_POLVA|nr:hypothetical protein PVAND_016259 [Polypedilum vanderplanki]
MLKIAATQNITKVDLTVLDSSQEDISIISSDVPMTPQTPLTVKRTARQKQNFREVQFTPSQSSPLRKNPKKCQSLTKLNLQSSPEVTPQSTSRLSQQLDTKIQVE